MTGKQLYESWCGSVETDRARYWMMMNPADKERWEELARNMTPDQEIATRAHVAIRTLETIATFDGGKAGELAAGVLREIGVWAEG